MLCTNVAVHVRIANNSRMATMAPASEFGQEDGMADGTVFAGIFSGYRQAGLRR